MFFPSGPSQHTLGLTIFVAAHALVTAVYLIQQPESLWMKGVIPVIDEPSLLLFYCDTVGAA